MTNDIFLEHVSLPAGRLLCVPGEAFRYVVVRRAFNDEVWIAPDRWSNASDAAGPFRPEDALRALRLACTSIPEGCERGPWTTGLAQFAPTRLPGHASDWSSIDPAHLPPSLSRYHVVDIDGGGGGACCSPSRQPPRVEWRHPPPGVLGDARDAGDGRDNGESEALLTLAGEQHPDLRPTLVGYLVDAWNAHPEGSAVLADRHDLSRGFVVVDRAAA